MYENYYAMDYYAQAAEICSFFRVGDTKVALQNAYKKYMLGQPKERVIK